MIQSENLDQLFTALSAFQGEVPNLFKSDTVKVTTRTGGSYNFKYVPLEEAVPVVRPLLAKYGLAVTQLPGAKSVLTVLAHSSGQYIGRDFSYEHLLPKDANSQAEGGLITYFRRYSFMAILGLVADEDDDSNSANGNSFTKTSTKATAKVTAPVSAPKPIAKPATKVEVPEPEVPVDDEPDSAPWIEGEVTNVPDSEDPIAIAQSFTDKKALQSWFNEAYKNAADKKSFAKEVGTVVREQMAKL